MSFADDEPLAHCIEMLRQVLTCNADVGVIPYAWVEGRDRPYPNFNTRHQCRNADSVVDWAVASVMPVEVQRQITLENRRPGEEVHATPP